MLYSFKISSLTAPPTTMKSTPDDVRLSINAARSACFGFASVQKTGSGHYVRQ